MKPIVIDIGLPRMGHQSLHHALTVLGYDYTSTWEKPPSQIGHFRRGCKFIYPIRPLENWLASCRRLRYELSEAQNEFWKMSDEELISLYNERTAIAKQLPNCLVYDIRDGWEPLVTFLGCGRPHTLFPQLDNRRQWHLQVKLAIDLAYGWISSLNSNSWLKDRPGTSSAMTRHFISNLCFRHGITFLGVGCNIESLLASAVYNNNNSIVKAYAADDWNNKIDELIACKHLMQQLNTDVQFINTNDISILQSRPNVCVIDTGHSHEKVVNILNSVWPILADESVLVLNHWNAPPVSDGWKDFYNGNKEVDIHSEWILATARLEKVEHWYNGVFVVVLRKPKCYQ